MDDQIVSPQARVAQAAAKAGIEIETMDMPASTRTAEDAAKACGCAVAQIVKSLIFVGRNSDAACLFLVSGANQVDQEAVADILGEPLDRPDADFVRRVTGFAIGGVAPFGHAMVLPTYFDEDLLEHEEVWAAAGTPNAVFKTTPQELVLATGADILSVTG